METTAAMGDPLDVQESLVKPLLQKLWEEESTKDLTIVASNNEKVKCHAAVFILASQFTKQLVADLPNDGALVMHFVDIPLKLIRSFLHRLYCLDKEDSSELDTLVKCLNIENPGLKESSLLAELPGYCRLTRPKNAFRDNVRIGTDVEQRDKPKTVIKIKALKPTVGNVILKPENPVKIKCEPDLMAMEDNDLVSCVKCSRLISPSDPGNKKLKALNGTNGPSFSYLCSLCLNVGSAVKRKMCSLCQTLHPVDAHHDCKKKTKQWKCEFCSSSLNSLGSLAIHKVSQHPDLTLSPCVKCGSQVTTQKSSRIVTCSKCWIANKVEPIPINRLGEPMVKKILNSGQSKTSQAKEPISREGECANCGKPVPRSSGSSSWMMTCSQCLYESKVKEPYVQKKSPAKTSMPSSGEEEEEEEWRCDQCNSTNFQSLSDLAIHKAIHHDKKTTFRAFNYTKGQLEDGKEGGRWPPGTKIQCPRCPAMVDANRVGEHDAQCHDERAPHPCQWCDYRSWTDNGLKQHHGRHHTSGKIACVNGCGASFNQKCSMVDHTRRHCKLAPPGEREKYRQIDVNSGRVEISRMKRRQKVENRQKLIKSICTNSVDTSKDANR